MKIWSNWNSHTPLVGKQDGTTLEFHPLLTILSHSATLEDEDICLFSPLPASTSSQLLLIMLLPLLSCYYLPSSLRAEPSPPRLGHSLTLSAENQERAPVWLWLCRYTNCQAKQGIKIVSLTQSHDYRSTVITPIPATLHAFPSFSLCYHPHQELQQNPSAIWYGSSDYKFCHHPVFVWFLI